MREECEGDAREKFELGYINPKLAGLWMSKYGYNTKEVNYNTGAEDSKVEFEWGDEVPEAGESGEGTEEFSETMGWRAGYINGGGQTKVQADLSTLVNPRPKPTHGQ